MESAVRNDEPTVEWSKVSNGYSAKGHYPITTLSKGYKTEYVWYNPFGEKIVDKITFDTLEEAQKFSEAFPKGEKLELWEVVYRFKQMGVKFR